MPLSKRTIGFLSLFAFGLIAAVVLIVPFQASASAAPPLIAAAATDPINVAWRRAQASGVYHFTTTVIETTHPAPTVANVGRSSTERRIYLEGDTDLPAQTLQMVLYQQGGSVLNRRDGIEVRIEGSEAYGRDLEGTWQPIDDFSGAFAPGNDLMAYLAGARNPRLVTDATSSQPSPQATQYAFDINGPEIATYMRDQMEEQLRRSGELPPGVTLDISDQFRDTIGSGDLWVDGDGLPLQLSIHLAYPQQQNGERVETEVITAFSAFDRRMLAEAQTPRGWLSRVLGLPTTAESWQALRQQITFAAGTLCMLATVLTHRRSRIVYAATIITIVVAMVITPLLQSNQVRAFNTRMAAEQNAQEARQADQRDAAEAQTALHTSTWNPHATLAEQAAADHVYEMANAIAPASELSSAGAPIYEPVPTTYSRLLAEATPEPESDDDGDGLTYAQEERLGTDPDEADTDGDQITDNTEVAGFRFAGKTWYSDPLNADTNNDGVNDGVECPEQARENEDTLSPSGATCQDTDGDGTPDIFDRDNDDDDVPDRVDLSPFSAMDNNGSGATGSAFDKDNPLLLQVDELTADHPVFVDFQLRPDNVEHLWYAFNVLDWPSGDEQAQIQRRAGNDSTWADVAEEGESVSDNADNGDMRLIPMLEIEIPYKDGHYGNLPVKDGAPDTRSSDLALDDWLDTSKLTPYGIAVRPKNDDGDLLAYVPLNLVQDETGGDRVAFAARMHYWPSVITEDETTTDWGITQQVRVVWAVHTLTDYRDEDGEWVTDVPQVVRAYPEAWSLTGLAVREDHGLDVAITYEDPGSDEDLHYDDPLWGVARGLEASFIVGRDEDDDGERDLTIAEIDTRFSLTSTSTITARFGISPEIGLDTRVYTYDHEDFITHIMMTETEKILDETFTDYVDAGGDVVTLLYSQESYARTANLDGDGDMAAVDGNALTIRLAQDSVPVEAAAYLNWGPFRYNDDDSAWESYPIAEYLDNLDIRLQDVLDEYKDEDNYEDILTGQILLAKAYYITLFHGLRGLVQMGPDLTGPQTPSQTDEELAEWIQGKPLEDSGGLIARQITTLTRGFYRAGIGASLYYRHKKAGDLFASIGGWVKEKKGNVANGWGNLGKLKKTLAIGVGVIAVAAVVTLLITAAVFFDGGEALVFVINGLSIIMSTVDIVMIGFSVVKRGTQTVVQALRNLKVLKLSLKAGAIAFSVAVIVIWGAFIYQVVQAGAKPGSLAFNSALATTIASTITSGILLAITAIPIVGQIIAALIFLIDAITMFVCYASDSDHWYCDYGISGLITEGIKWIIYSANVMIDIEDDERLDITEFETGFVDPDKGLSVGNSLVFTTTVENEIELIEWKDTNYDWKAGAYWWQYSDKTLESSTFEYQLADQEIDIHQDLDRGDIRSDWKNAGNDRVRLIASAETDVALSQSGINRTADLYLVEGYALPVQECWAFPIVIPFPPIYLLIPVCYVRTERGSGSIDLGKELYYDIFPETLDGFYDLAVKDGGYTLAWSQDSDPAFPRLKDADGDGLRNYMDEGADPDDGDWDTDNDTLSDAFEHEHGTDPRDSDSDDDGLTDREELLLGTSPLRTDTDYDGLTDKEEIDGWEFVYDFAEDGSQIRTWVTSDPLAADPDLDTLTDFQEKTFGFHPQVPSDPHVLSLDAKVREAHAPHLLLRFSETAGAATFSDDSGYANNGSCQGLSCPVSGHEGRYGNAAHFDGTDDYLTADGVCKTIADQPSSASDYSLGAWVYPEGGTTGDTIILALNTATGDNILHLGVNADSRRIYITTPDHRTESSAITFNQWHHVAVVVDAGGTGRLYVDGSQVGTISTTAYPTADSRFSIGQEWDGDVPGNFFLGLIDEVLVFDHALSQSEIDELQAGRYNPQDQVVRPSDTLDYEASVKNQLYNRYAQGLLSTHFPAGFSEIPPQDFILNPQEETVLDGTVTVAGNAASGAYSLTHEVDALITDWREASDYADLLYHFAETTPPFEDSSGSQPPRDGDCSGDACPTSDTGRYGNGLSFDGADDYVANDNVTRYLTGDAFTMGAWVNPSSSMSGSGTIMAFNTEGGGNANTLMYNADTLKFFYRDPETSRVYAANAVTVDTWHYVMLVVEPNDTATLYINGAEAASLRTPVRPDADGTFNVGQEWDGSTPSEFFKGRMDEIVVFNRALTAEEAEAYYSDPVLSLPLDDNAGATSFDDASAFDNDAGCSGDHCPTAGVSGVAGQAAQFSGDDYLTVPAHSALALEDAFSLSAWIYPEGEANAASSCEFRAEYFSNTSLVTNEDTVRRCESWPINHDWGTGTALPPDRSHEFYNYFSVRWTGTYLFQEGEHTFSFDHDDGMRVWLDDDQLLDDWSEGINSQQVTRQVAAGLHTVKVEYRENSGSARAEVSWNPPPLAHPQGILGDEDYPAIQRVGDRVQLILNDHTSYLSPAGTLAQGTWNHVVTTFDGSTLTLYVDGVKVGELAAVGETPGAGSGFDIGRTDQTTQLRLQEVSVLETADTDSGGDWPDELILQLRQDNGNWQSVWNTTEAWAGDEFPLSIERTFEDEIMLRMVESDDGEYDNCSWLNNNCDGEDPEDDAMGTVVLSASEPSAYESISNFQSDSQRSDRDRADLLWYTETDAVPFEGKIDEVRVYKQAFTPDEVSDLYDSGTQVVRLALDDAPGVTEFTGQLGQATGTCSDTQCPTAGLPGRDGWAVSFDGADDVITVEEANTDNLDTLTVAAWVKPDTLPTGEVMRFVTLSNEKAVLRYDGAQGPGQLHFYATLDGALHHIRVDNALASGQWTHIAGTYDGSELRLYKNGQLLAAQPATGSLSDGNTLELSHPTETLDGMLDEVLVVRRALGAGEIADLVAMPPQLILTLDETSATTQFADDSGNDNTGTCGDTHCPSAGVKGQLGLATDFDGDDDVIRIPHDDALAPDNAMTLIAWIKATDPDVDQKIAGKSSMNDGYVLGIKDGQLYPEIWDSSSARWSDQWGQINPDTWTFVAVTWETGDEMIGYINGEIAGRIDAGSLPIGVNAATQMVIGAAPWSISSFNVNGRIDHVLLYHRALSPQEMQDLFRLQAKWVEERHSTDITVDADATVSTLVSDDTYRPNQDMILLATTEDATSQVTMLEMGVSTTYGATYAWESAPACRTAAALLGSGQAWCPTFEPTAGEGRYLIRLRATDNVGNQETPAETHTFLVDDTPPVPHTTLQDEQLLQAHRRPNSTWLVPLSGTIADPVIAGTTEPGSGVSDVQVRLTATAHPTDTLAPRTAALDNGNWTIDYPLPYADATGTYTLSVRGSDNVGNVGDFTTLVTIALDTAPPAASLDGSNTMTVPITSTLTLTGLITETGVVSSGLDSLRAGFTPMAMQAMSGTVATFHLDEAPTASEFRNNNGGTATCAGGGCPAAGVPGVWGTATEFDGNDYLTADFVSTAITETDGFSFGAWVRPEDTGERKSVLAFNAANGTDRNQLLRSNYRYCYYDGDIGPACSSLHAGIDDTWRLVVVVITEEGNGTLYIDGEVGLEFETSVLPDPDGRFSIGHEWDGDTASEYFLGNIDEVVVFDRALTPEEITTFYGNAVLSNRGDGVLETDWQLDVPTGLDGLYAIHLRPSDVFSNTPGSDWEAWNGEIDTQAPRVEIEAEELVSYLSMKTRYTCRAQDFNLVWNSLDHPEDSFQCVCQMLAPAATVYTPTYYHDTSPWYAEAFTDTNRLYQLEASCTVPGPALDGAQVTACDIYGHCDFDVGEPSQIELLRATDSAVITPTLNSVITSTAPLPIESEAYAASYLQTFSLTVDGVEIDTRTWAEAEQVNEATIASVWTTPTEGKHVLTSLVHGHNGDPQPLRHPVTIWVDVAPPAIDIDPLVLTTTHRLSQGRVALTGNAADTNGIRSVEVKVEDEAWQEASLYGTDWQLDWYLGEEPAGENYTVTARATDAAGHTTRVTETVYVNLETPNPITLTLASAGNVITSATTLVTVPSTLDLSWITETQQADLLPYEVVWTIYTTETQTFSAPVPAAGPLSTSYVAGEAQRIQPRVISRLADGNSQSDVYDTVTVDTPLTPDYISLETAPGERRPYLGWMTNGCAELGVDRRVAENAPESAAVGAAQRLYATWDSEALRLAWTGANWDYAGDLFIYLDTVAGGAAQAIDVSGSDGTGIQLPDDLGFGADVAIWVEDAQTANLLTWNPSALDWDTRLLSPDEFRFEAGLNEGQTDLYLPFDVLEIDDPATSPLALVAYATEENAMELWGTMPPANPVNSSRVVETGVYAPEDVTFGLTQVYAWPALAPGMCPSNAFGDADVHLELSVEPAGAAYSFLGSDLFWLWEDLIDGTPPVDISKAFTFLDVDHPILKEGDDITYTLRYSNQGTETATDIQVYATAYAALRFSGAVTQVISLGDIPPGESGIVSFRGEIDREAARTTAYEPCLSVGAAITCSQYLSWATMEATVVDPVFGLSAPLDTLWATHEVDGEPPEFYGIQQPQAFISPGSTTFSGYAFDPSGVPTVSLHQQAPANTTTCIDPTPDDGQWQCEWDATQANGGVAPGDGTTLNLQVVPTDGAGISLGTVPLWRTFMVDANAPEAAYSAETTAAYSGTVVADTSLSFSGLITDNHGVDAIEVCLNGDCDTGNVQALGQASSVITDAIATPAAIPNCPSVLARTFEVSDTFAIGEVQLGINADHSRRNDVLATLTSPSGTTVTVLGPRNGTPFEAANYDVWLVDSAGAGLHDVKVDDDTGVPIYDRVSRPSDPLSTFQEEISTGTWTLELCDSDPVTKTGSYNHSELTVIPRNAAATEGTWSYTEANLENVDGVPHTVEAYAIDTVGNRGEGIALTFEVDNVAPALDAQQQRETAALTPEGTSLRVLDGTVTDGGSGEVQMYAFVRLPSGKVSTRQVGQNGESWWFDLQLDMPGTHKIWINARDAADNVTTFGPAVVTAVQLEATADSPAAVGAQTALTATLVGDSGYSFDWNPGDGTTSIPGAVATHTYTTIGVFTATVTATKGSHVFTATTEVETAHMVSGLTVINDGPTVISDTTTLTATVATGSDVDFTWDLGDGTLTYGPVVKHEYLAEGNYGIVVTASNKINTEIATTTVSVGMNTHIFLPLIMKAATGLSR